MECLRSLLKNLNVTFKNDLHLFGLTPSKESLNTFFAKLHSGSKELGSISKEMIFGVVITKNFDVVSNSKRLVPDVTPKQRITP